VSDWVNLQAGIRGSLEACLQRKADHNRICLDDGVAPIPAVRGGRDGTAGVGTVSRRVPRDRKFVG
jgi:hypothetical protein